MGQPQLVILHGQRRHADLVNQEAAAIGPAVGKYLQIGESGQGAFREWLALGQEAALDLDEEVGSRLGPFADQLTRSSHSMASGICSAVNSLPKPMLEGQCTLTRRQPASSA